MKQVTVSDDVATSEKCVCSSEVRAISRASSDACKKIMDAPVRLIIREGDDREYADSILSDLRSKLADIVVSAPQDRWDAVLEVAKIAYSAAQYAYLVRISTIEKVD